MSTTIIIEPPDEEREKPEETLPKGPEEPPGGGLGESNTDVQVVIRRRKGEAISIESLEGIICDPEGLFDDGVTMERAIKPGHNEEIAKRREEQKRRDEELERQHRERAELESWEDEDESDGAEPGLGP